MGYLSKMRFKSFLKLKLAFRICTWYILIPAKKTQETRCGKRMKNKFRKKLKKRACKVGSDVIRYKSC
ncbi:hypothetical protein B2I21_05790 [Chryseobacterium mucoviscidosis]|nr:hypothetical protein B2I21_05790 [Chryseobacterium mucoviscidosis]